MGNVEIYRKTLRFSVMRLLVTILGIFIIVALPLATFLVTAGMSEVACAVATFVAFILISVMRRYIEAGLANPPKVDLYGKLAGMSAGFRKALERDKEEVGAVA